MAGMEGFELPDVDLPQSRGKTFEFAREFGATSERLGSRRLVSKRRRANQACEASEVTSRALPWFELYVEQDWSAARMLLRNMG